MGTEVERRLLAVAAAVLVAGLGSLPFAGHLGPATSVVIAGAPPAALPPPPLPIAPIAPAPLLAPVDAPSVVEPPPIDLADLTSGIGAPTDAPEVVAVSAASTPPEAGGAAVTSLPSGAHPERIWAVTVGIDDYPGANHDLQAAANDARTVADALAVNGVPGDHVLQLVNGQATVDGLLAAVDWVVANAGPDDTAVFFYAGHVRDLGGGTEVLVTADGGWIADWRLRDRLASLQARDAWMVIAACFGGGFDELGGPGRVVTAAAPPGQLAYETDGFGRSYLAEYLFARALVARQAGEPTVQAAVAWAMRELQAHYPEHQLWHQDQAGHIVSLDGSRRDAVPPSSSPVAPQPSPAPPAAPPTTEPPERCLLILMCG